ncbi:MAG: HalOD1 output domain-containing protein [Haloarculaceae archaeon]
MEFDGRCCPDAGLSYEVPADETFSDAVVVAVSTASGDADLPAMDGQLGGAPTLEPLYSVLDPDALDAVFRRADDDGAPGHVQFRYHGCDVTVHSEGRVCVAETEGAGSSASGTGAAAE